jgi:hypothetical protein
MGNRVIFLAALAFAVVLLPRVYDTAETLIDVFPIDEGEVWFVDLDPAPWYSAVFVAAHACVAWCAALIWRRQATLSLRILTLILLGELIAIYVMTFRFWVGGIEVRLY